MPHFIASVTVETPNAGSQTFIGVSHFEAGASTQLGERIEAFGFTPAQVGKILDRVRVSKMKPSSFGGSITLPGSLHHPFGRKA
jgi:hypothetical protein